MLDMGIMVEFEFEEDMGMDAEAEGDMSIISVWMSRVLLETRGLMQKRRDRPEHVSSS